MSITQGRFLPHAFQKTAQMVKKKTVNVKGKEKNFRAKEVEGPRVNQVK